MAEGGKPFLWTGKDPSPSEDDGTPILDSNEHWDLRVLPGGQGVTGVKPTYKYSAKWEKEAQQITWPGERKPSFAMITQRPETRPHGIAMCVCNNHPLPDDGSPVLRVDGYVPRSYKQCYLYSCLKCAPLLLGESGLNVTLKMSWNFRCALRGEKYQDSHPCVTLSGPENPWGRSPVSAHRDFAVGAFAEICAMTGADPRTIISVGKGIGGQEADEFFEAVEEAMAQINPATFVAPPANFAQPQTSTVVSESVRGDRSKKKKKTQQQPTVCSFFARAPATPAPRKRATPPAPARAAPATREVIEIPSNDEVPAPAPAPAPASSAGGEKRAASSKFFQPRKKTKPAPEIIEID